jgi:hypothetical protein
MLIALTRHMEAILNAKFSQKSSESRIEDLVCIDALDIMPLLTDSKETPIKTLQWNLIQKPGLFQTVCNDAQQLGLLKTKRIQRL